MWTQSSELDVTQAQVTQQWAHDRPLIATRFHPSGDYVFCGSEDAVVERFRLSDGTKTLLSDGHATWVKALACSTDGRWLLSGGYDGRITWWDAVVESPVPVRSVAAHGTQWIRCLATRPGHSSVASCGNDACVRLWSIDDGAQLAELPGHEKHVWSVAWDAAGGRLFSGDLGGVIRQWDIDTGKEVRSLDGKELWSFNGGQRVDFGGVRALACSPDNRLLAAGGLYKASNPLGAIHEPLILLFNLESGEVERQLTAEGITQGVIWRLCWLSDGTLMAVCGGGSGGFLIFWKPDQDKDIHRFQLPNIARDMDLHADGIRVATAHHDRHVRITRLAAKTEAAAG